MFKFLNPNKITIVRQCKKSKLFLLQGTRVGACLGYGKNEDKCISDLPDGLFVTLPDDSTWQIKSKAWCAVIPKGKPAKATAKTIGGESW